MRANRKNITAAQRDFPEVPRLTPEQIEALDLLDQLMADDSLCFSMWLERGDMQLLNSYVTLHSRTDFEDFDEPEPQAPPVPPVARRAGFAAAAAEWEEYFGDVRAGSVRGGVRGSAITPEFLDYEARQARALGMPYRPRGMPAEAQPATAA